MSLAPPPGPPRPGRLRRALRSRTAPLWVALVVVALVVGGWFAFIRDDGSAGSGAAAATEVARVVQATTGTMARTVSAEGTVAAAATDDLSFDVAGTVTAVDVAAGDTVHAGQVLATLDSADLRAAVSSAVSDLADAEAKLSDDQAAGASDAQVAADQSAVTTKRDAVAGALRDLAGAQLVATIDGTVTSVDLTVGEQLGSGGTGATDRTGSASGSGASSANLGSTSQSSRGGIGATGSSGGSTSTSTAQIQVVSSGSYQVQLGLDASSVASVAVGQVATLTVTTSSSSSSNFGFPGGGRFGGGGFGGGGFGGGGFPGEGQSNGSGSGRQSNRTGATGATTTGTVTSVGRVADASSGVATYPVTVSFQSTGADFAVGTTVSAAITVDQVSDAIQVPSRAVTTAADGTTTVAVSTDGTADHTTTRTVTTGLTADGMVQITSGLRAGESVVVRAFVPGGAFGTFSRTAGAGTPQRAVVAGGTGS